MSVTWCEVRKSLDCYYGNLLGQNAVVLHWLFLYFIDGRNFISTDVVWSNLYCCRFIKVILRRRVESHTVSCTLTRNVISAVSFLRSHNELCVGYGSLSVVCIVVWSLGYFVMHGTLAQQIAPLALRDVARPIVRRVLWWLVLARPTKPRC
jgi:hypothetical protein